jgi:hypothetical protein
MGMPFLKMFQAHDDTCHNRRSENPGLPLTDIFGMVATVGAQLVGMGKRVERTICAKLGGWGKG